MSRAPKLIAIITSFMVAAVLTLSVASATEADVGELPVPGGVVAPGDKTQDIQMADEDVVFKVMKNDSAFADKPQTTHYAHVTAKFTMRNLTQNSQTKEIFFPFFGGFQQDTGPEEQAKNVKISVNGTPATVSYKELAPYNDNGSQVAVFNATFQPNADTNITIEYDVRAVNAAKSYGLVFSYVMETGSHWAGKIGQGRVTFDFEENIDSLAPFTQVNSFFKPENGNLVWNFKDLEPTADNNISVAFSPDILSAWSKRPSFIKDVTSSHLVSQTFVTDNVRGANDEPGGRILSEAANLFDYDQESYGWLTKTESDTVDEWVEIGLDADYTIDKLEIRSGYLDREWSGQDYYDTFRRPKNVTITYSDGTTQEAALQDEPSEYQTITLKDRATDKLRLSFKDYYNGVGGGNNYFGVGRIKLAGVTKVAQEKVIPNDEAGSSSKLPWIIGSIIGVAVLAAILTVILVIRNRKKHSSISQPADNSRHKEDDEKEQQKS